jgi:hypothetical protein
VAAAALVAMGVGSPPDITCALPARHVSRTLHSGSHHAREPAREALLFARPLILISTTDLPTQVCRHSCIRSTLAIHCVALGVLQGGIGGFTAVPLCVHDAGGDAGLRARSGGHTPAARLCAQTPLPVRYAIHIVWTYKLPSPVRHTPYLYGVPHGQGGYTYRTVRCTSRGVCVYLCARARVCVHTVSISNVPYTYGIPHRAVCVCV